MGTLSTTYLHRAEITLCLTALLYFLLNGAQIFETLILVPKWTHRPPENFGLLLDGNGPGLNNFWIIFHSLHEISFILAIVFCWKIAPIRNALLLLFGLHLGVRIWTIGYFAPQIIQFQKIATATAEMTPTTGSAGQASRWQLLNYIRVALFLLISLGLLPLCYRLLHFQK